MVDIILANEGNMKEILEIEQASFPIPWLEGSLLSMIDRDDVFFSVAMHENSVVGFYIAYMADGEGELYQIAVREEFRGRGIADVLMMDMRKCAKSQGIKEMFLEVRAGNFAAISLYEKHGFISLGIRKGYYNSPIEDAIVMQCEFF